MPKKWRGKRDREEKCKAVIFPTTVSALPLSALLGSEKTEEKDHGGEKDPSVNDRTRMMERVRKREHGDERPAPRLPRSDTHLIYLKFNLIIRYLGGVQF